jgi:hypothetical protein
MTNVPVVDAASHQKHHRPVNPNCKTMTNVVPIPIVSGVTVKRGIIFVTMKPFKERPINHHLPSLSVSEGPISKRAVSVLYRLNVKVARAGAVVVPPRRPGPMVAITTTTVRPMARWWHCWRVRPLSYLSFSFGVAIKQHVVEMAKLP